MEQNAYDGRSPTIIYRKVRKNEYIRTINRIIILKTKAKANYP
ncbi:unnamed protein product [Allacma fusca]|uniref:Uncharacterized protein n=1 Tax=Allacma fusca TaxID=39272 RepID=A0A8J2K422_9HEXA|nr:unnamed protein product [Allacma fusca]